MAANVNRFRKEIKPVGFPIGFLFSVVYRDWRHDNIKFEESPEYQAFGGAGIHRSQAFGEACEQTKTEYKP